MVQPTYVFENGKVYAFDGKRIVASAPDIDQLEARLADKDQKEDLPNNEEDPKGDMNDRAGEESDPDRDDTNKGKFPTPDSKPFEGEGEDEDEDDDKDKKSRVTHVVTPNGLRGKILGHYKGVFGDQVTVKWDNGRITPLSTSGVKFEGPEQEKQSSNPVERLESAIAKTTTGDRGALTDRRSELLDIKKEASNTLRLGAPWEIEQRLDDVVAQASHELREIKDALDHLDTAEAVAPTKHDSKAATQVDFGHKSASTWLDSTLESMSREAEETDYEKLMEEGPTLFVLELNSGVLGDAEATRELAADHVRSKTAAANVPERDRFEKLFLDRVETARKEELETRPKRQQPKEASVEDYDGPDDALFF